MRITKQRGGELTDGGFNETHVGIAEEVGIEGGVCGDPELQCTHPGVHAGAVARVCRDWHILGTVALRDALHTLVIRLIVDHHDGEVAMVLAQAAEEYGECVAGSVAHRHHAHIGQRI